PSSGARATRTRSSGALRSRATIRADRALTCTDSMERRDRRPKDSTEAPATPPRALRLYVGLVTAAGASTLVYSAATLITLSHPWQWMLLGGCGILTGSFAVNISFVSASISVADTFSIATALLFGPGAAAVVLATDTGVLSW